MRKDQKLCEKSNLMENVVMYSGRSVIELEMDEVHLIEVEDQDEYYDKNNNERFIRSIAIKLKNGALIALVCTGKTQINVMHKHYLDIESLVAETRGMPLPSIPEVAKKLVDYANGMESGEEKEEDESRKH